MRDRFSNFCPAAVDLGSSCCWLIHALIVVFFSTLVAAAPSDEPEIAGQYRALRKEYLQLVKSDPKISDSERWDDIASRLQELTSGKPDPEYAAKILFVLARLYEYKYREKQSSEDITLSIDTYERLYTNYSESELADDAMLAVADFRKELDKEPSVAISLYQRLVAEFPKGDMVPQAKQRLVKSGVTIGGLDPKSPEQGKIEQPEVSGLGGVAPTWLWSKDSSVAAGQSDLEPHPLMRRLKRQLIVVIDPGHGGEEEGALGYGGVLEKEVVLNISIFLEEQLRKRLGIKVILTRVRDVTIPLAERTKLANDSNADIFISIHTNASKSKTASGIETYYLDNTNDQSSLRLAERENASAGAQLTDLGFIVSDLIQDAKLDDSISLAHKLHDAIVRKVKKKYPDTKDLGVKKAPFFVLVGAHMPCVLLEVSFIDHKIEGQRLVSFEHQKLLAEAIFQGFVSYLASRTDLQIEGSSL